MRISTIVPAFKQTDLTVVHVRECMNSSLVPDEIIVVNDFGDTGLRDKLYALPRKCKIVYAFIRQDVGFGYHHACNLGLWLSRGDAVTIEDADHIPLRNAYANAVALLEERPEVNRVGFRREWVPISDALDKPFEEWQPYGGLGANAMVAMYRRELLLDMKGFEERMNKWGWLAYDVKSRMKKVGLVGAVVNSFYIIKNGSEDNIVRGMPASNANIYRQNARHPHPHNEFGIMNYEFDIERWEKNV